jgi:hypothetical protein
MKARLLTNASGTKQTVYLEPDFKQGQKDLELLKSNNPDDDFYFISVALYSRKKSVKKINDESVSINRKTAR